MRHRAADTLPAPSRDPRRKLPPDAEPGYCADYRAGMGLAALATRYGLGIGTAWREARRLGLPRRYTTRAA